MYSYSFLHQQISGKSLDNYLSNGCYRFGNKMFTTNFLCFDDEYYNAFWLRYDLSKFQLSKKQIELIKRNKKFTVSINKFILTEEKDALYVEYRAQTPFPGILTLGGLLHDYDLRFQEIFDSYEICLYDDDKLIACGVFDMGEDTYAGIVTFYDQTYKKYSLGKYIILLKILYGKQLGKKYFYPGYFAPGYKSFDYKLSYTKECIQWYKFTTKTWLPIDQCIPEEYPLSTIISKLEKLKIFLRKNNHDVKLWKYKYFDTNLYINYLFFLPITDPYFLGFANKKHKKYIIIYSIEAEKYQLHEVNRHHHNMDNKKVEGLYNQHLLVINEKSLIEFTDFSDILTFLDN